MRIWWGRGTALLLLFGLACAGCGRRGGGLPAVATDDQVNLKALAVSYGHYQAKNKGKPPPNAQEHKKFIKSMDANTLAGLRVDPADVEKLFVSPRDGEPYVVRYNVPANPSGGVPNPMMTQTGVVIAYEKNGKNGKHLIAVSTGEVQEVDEDRLHQL